MKIVDTNTFGVFESKFKLTESIVIPIQSSHEKHVRHSDNDLSLLFVSFLDGDSYMLPISHNEAYSVGIPYTDKRVYTPDKKLLCSVVDLPNVVDVNFMNYLHTGEPLAFTLEDTPAHTFLKRLYSGKVDSVNYIIPIVKHAESCVSYADKLRNELSAIDEHLDTEPLKFVSGIESDAFQFIERSGLHVDVDAFKQKFGSRSEQHLDGDLVYTEYNLYNMTGRPSNRHGGVNYAALPKEDGTRKMFTSRYGDGGGLVMLDYDGYHLRIIGELIGYEFPNDISVHEYFGKQYFHKDVLSDQEYNESKKISFSLLYGGVSDDYKHIEFFKRVQNLIRFISDSYNKDGVVASPISGRLLRKSLLGDMNPQKLLSYYIQMMETDYNIVALHSTIPMFQRVKTKLILYTYDAFLLDYSKEDGKDFILGVKESLEQNKKFPMKIYFGRDYHNMIDVTKHFQSM